MKVINNIKPETTPMFEFKKGGVYRNRENGCICICLSIGMHTEYRTLRLFSLDSYTKLHHGTPDPDPKKWEEVYATLTLTNKQQV